MPDFTAEAPARATKATPKTKAAPSPALASAAPENRGAKPTSDEQFVAATLREQVVAICETRWDDLRGESIEVLHAAAEALETLPHGAYKGLYRASSLVASALAVERESTPPGAAIPQLEAVYLSLDTASLGYNVEMEPHEAMAAGIRAGQHKPSGAPSSVHQYNHAQLCAIITGIASVALTLDRVLMSAQVTEDDWDTSVLIDTAQLLARQLGGMADSAVGGQIIGAHDEWNYGPNFTALGKAGAA